MSKEDAEAWSRSQQMLKIIENEHGVEWARQLVKDLAMQTMLVAQHRIKLIPEGWEFKGGWIVKKEDFSVVCGCTL